MMKLIDLHGNNLLDKFDEQVNSKIRNLHDKSIKRVKKEKESLSKNIKIKKNDDLDLIKINSNNNPSSLNDYRISQVGDITDINLEEDNDSDSDNDNDFVDE